ncbi:hypothetical protein [Methanofollis ethanolicus]|uniref:hypothetical protein n=1 Tax=Methanofollis ethanolicus TaxID=488124 RepID=UPI0013654A6B|nr:hypothetical protein [Methanofollis ethanolicus]
MKAVKILRIHIPDQGPYRILPLLLAGTATAPLLRQKNDPAVGIHRRDRCSDMEETSDLIEKKRTASDKFSPIETPVDIIVHPPYTAHDR